MEKRITPQGLTAAGEPVAVVVIPLYPTRIKLADARLAKYYKQGEVPEKVLPRVAGYDKRKRALDKWGKHIVSNPVSAGTARYISLSGNVAYSGWHERERMKVVAGIKDHMRPFIRQMQRLPEGIPLKLEMYLYSTPGAADWDCSNKWLYTKCFEDLLQAEDLLENDSIRCLSSSGAVHWEPITDEKQRKLVFVFSHDERRSVRTHLLYTRDGVWLGTETISRLPHLELYLDDELRNMQVVATTRGISFFIRTKGANWKTYLSDVLAKVYLQLLQTNKHFLYISCPLPDGAEDIIEESLLKKGVCVHYPHFIS